MSPIYIVLILLLILCICYHFKNDLNLKNDHFRGGGGMGGGRGGRGGRGYMRGGGRRYENRHINRPMYRKYRYENRPMYRKYRYVNRDHNVYPIYNVYADYIDDKVYVKFYYDNMMSDSQKWMGLYNELRDELGVGDEYYFHKNNESVNKTSGITNVPTWIRSQGGVNVQYEGGPNYVDLKNFILGM